MSEAEKAKPSVGSSSRRTAEAGVVALLILLSLLLFFHRLGSLTLFDADEPAFAEAAREMLISDDWITPYFNFEPRFDKPILFYWLIALAYQAFGIGEFAARFWSAMFATALVLSIYLFGRKVLGRRAALIASLAFAGNVGTAVLARAAVTDMTLTFFMTWTFFCLLSAYRTTGRVSERYLVVGYFAMGLAVLAKGPIGLLIPVLVIGLFLALQRRAGASLGRFRPLLGFSIFAGVALPWYILALYENGWDFVQGFIVKHHLVRYTGVVSGNAGALYYFLPVVLVGFFPWSGVLPRAFSDLWSIRTRLRGDLTAREELLLFLWLWFGVVFVFFSLSGTKLPSYVFPAFPALAMLVGAAWDPLFDEGIGAGRWGKAFDWVVGGIAFPLAVSLPLVPWIAGNIRIRGAPEMPPLHFGLAPYALAILFLLGSAIAVWARRRGWGSGALATLATTTALTILLAAGQVVPVFEERFQRPLRDLADAARQELGPRDLLVAYDLNAPSLVFYARRRVVRVERCQEARFRRLAASAGRLFVIAKTNAAPRLREVPEIFPLDRRGGYVLYSSRYSR